MCIVQALKEGSKYAIKNPGAVLLPSAAIPLGAATVKHGVEEEQKARAEALLIRQTPAAPPVSPPMPPDKDVAELEAALADSKRRTDEWNAATPAERKRRKLVLPGTGRPLE